MYSCAYYPLPVVSVLSTTVQLLGAFRCDKESPTPLITYDDQIRLIAQEDGTESFCGYCDTIKHELRYPTIMAEKLAQRR